MKTATATRSKAKSAPSLRAPFPAFGGKRGVAALVWERLGNVRNFIEPFCYSAAVLFCRPDEPGIETINDEHDMVANFWRAVQQDPEAVAKYADNPVNETDLHARHRYLVLSEDAAAFREKMRADPHYFDARIAGYWCWGLCCWIGGGWCTPHGTTKEGLKQESPNLSQHGKGVTKLGPSSKRPKLSGNGIGNGVHRKTPKLRQRMPTAEQCSTGGKGVNGVGVADAIHVKRQALGNSRGVTSGNNRPQLADAYDIGRGVNSHGELGTCEERRAWLVRWFRRLSDRLRLTRVCCGDWLRVCDSRSVTTRLGQTGIFFDPPYSLDVARMHRWVRHLTKGGPAPKASAGATNRDANLYSTDGEDVDLLVARVHVYCRERGSMPGYRIALCGYAGEHDALEKLGWSVASWRAHGGYGNRSAKGKANARRERIWFSPGCIQPAPDLFSGMK